MPLDGASDYRFIRNCCRFSDRRLVRPSESAIRAGTKVDRLLLKAIPKRIGEGAVLWHWLLKLITNLRRLAAAACERVEDNVFHLYLFEAIL